MRNRMLLPLGSAAVMGLLVGLVPSLHAQARRPAAKAAAPKAAPKAPPAVSLAGLQVVAKSLGKARFGDTIAFNSEAGVTLAIAVKVAPGTAILDIDDDESAVETWTDDKDTDLNIEPDFGSFPTYTEDQSAGIITVRSPVVPAAGSQQVSIKGALAVTTATGTQTVKSAKVALTKGTAFKVGALAGTIGDVEPSDTGGAVSVRFTGSSAGAIKDMKFLDAAGTEIESERNGSMTSSDEVELMYTLKAKATTAVLAVELWQGRQTTAVPFDLTASVGALK